MLFTRQLFTAALLSLTALPSLVVTAKEAKTFVIDPAHTSVNFSVNHLGYSDVTGRFNNVKGQVDVEQSGVAKINIQIDSASVDTNHEKRDAHLRSPDFFHAKQFPVITLNSDFDVNKNAKVLVGEVSLLGKTKTVEFAVKKGKEGTDPWGAYRIGYSAQATIKRSEFGMNFMQGGLGDDINVQINIEAVQK